MASCTEEPGPDLEGLKKRFGENASEYANVRAKAAARAGDPDVTAWAQVAKQLAEEHEPQGSASTR
jgi:hypothetical protein